MKLRDNLMDIRVRDSIFEPGSMESKGQNRAYKRSFKSVNKKSLYKVWIYLEGDDLPFVKRVKYILHSTFRDPIHIIERTSNNQNCKMTFWTWGIFEVRVEIEDTRGRAMKMEHRLQYHHQIRKENINWMNS